MVHTQAGYLLYTALTHRMTFDYRGNNFSTDWNDLNNDDIEHTSRW